MRPHYYADTDSLYIDVSENLSVESHEISPGVVLDYDVDGQVCGIDIDHASKKYDLPSTELGGVETYLLCESALSKDWLTPEEDEA